MQHFLKTACLNTGCRGYCPFQYWYIQKGNLTRAAWWHLHLHRLSNHFIYIIYSWASNSKEGEDCGHQASQLVLYCVFGRILVLSLWKDRDHMRLQLQGQTWQVFPIQPHHSALYPLKDTSTFRAQAPKQVGRTWVAIWGFEHLQQLKTLLKKHGWGKDGRS